MNPPKPSGPRLITVCGLPCSDKTTSRQVSSAFLIPKLHWVSAQRRFFVFDEIFRTTRPSYFCEGFFDFCPNHRGTRPCGFCDLLETHELNSMRPHFPTLASIGLALIAALPGYSDDLVFKNSSPNATLVELYSSEGCSSCPPAEAWVSDLKKSPALWKELFPVAFHVNYWDNLGWPDRFAKSAYTQRQRNYAVALGQDSVYTPEFVTSGREWRGWFDGNRQPKASIPTKGELSIQVKPDGRQVSGSYSPDPQEVGSSSYTLNVALLGVNIHSNVASGENGGRNLVHDFVVLDFTSARLSKAQNFQSGPLNLKSSTDDRPGALVAWLSAPDGTIVQVAGGYLPGRAATASDAAGN